MKLIEVISNSNNDRAILFDCFRRQLENVFSEETERELFFLAFTEAVNNAAEHGNRDNPTKKININGFFKENFSSVSVTDEGEGFLPVFPDLKRVKSGRGRGLGFIKANADAVFFNRKGNRITFLKGGKNMEGTFDHINAKLTIISYDGIVLVTEIEKKRGSETKFSNGIAEIFDALNGFRIKKILIDLSRIKLLTSADWGSLFASAERKDLELIHLFNACEAIQTTAKQLGIDKRNDSFGKIKIFADDEEVQNIIENKKINYE